MCQRDIRIRPGGLVLQHHIRTALRVGAQQEKFTVQKLAPVDHDRIRDRQFPEIVAYRRLIDKPEDRFRIPRHRYISKILRMQTQQMPAQAARDLPYHDAVHIGRRMQGAQTVQAHLAKGHPARHFDKTIQQPG